MLAILSSIILKIIDKNICYIAGFELIISLLINQSSNVLISYKNCIKELNSCRKRIKLTLLVIWILGLFFITQEFTNLLLDIYFNVKSGPIINSAEELCNNQDISVKTTLFRMEALITLCPTKLIKNLLPRIKVFESWSVFLGNQQNLIDVIEGKAIILIDSSTRPLFSKMMELQHILINPDNKYWSVYTSFIIIKIHKYAKLIYYL